MPSNTVLYIFFINLFKTPNCDNCLVFSRKSITEKTSNISGTHTMPEIWKRNSHRPFWLYVWGKLRQRNRRIILTPSFAKNNNVFKMLQLCSHENAEGPEFSNSSSLKSIFEKLCFREGLVWTVCLSLSGKLSCVFKFFWRFVDGT